MSDTWVIERVALITVAIVSVSLVLRLIYYHAKLRATTHYRNAYERFREATASDPANHSLYAELLEKQTEIVKLFKEAQLSPPTISYVEPAGYGYVHPTRVSSWDNLHHDSAELQLHNMHSFHRAMGYFRARRNETISPVFWIESLVNWPRLLLGFLGFNSEGAFAKFLQMIVWILKFAVGVLAVANSMNV